MSYIPRNIEQYLHECLKDTGLLCTLRGINEAAIHSDKNLMDSLMETWVCTELLKAIAVSDADCQLFHYRDKNKRGSGLYSV